MEKIKELENKIAILEKKIQQLESRDRVVFIPQPYPVYVQPYMPGPSFPYNPYPFYGMGGTSGQLTSGGNIA